MTSSVSIIRQELVGTAVNLKMYSSFSGVREKLIELIERGDLSLREITELISYDPGLSTKILSIANSPYFSRGIPILSLDQAILTIGLKEVRNIILCLTLLNDLLKRSRMKREDLLYMWGHSVFVALASKLLSQRLLVDEPEKVFTISLFHDIGKLVFFAMIDWYRENINEAISKRMKIQDLERERYGITHNELGVILAKKMKMPDYVISVIELHCTAYPGNSFEGSDPLISLVNAANRYYYFRDSQEIPYGYILSKEEFRLEKEVEKFTVLVGKG